MSADNWTYCPQCKMNRHVELAKLREAADNAYGNVSIEKFDALRQKTDAFSGKQLERTLREDWELWVDGELQFHVRYYVSCQTCGLKLEFKHDGDIPVQKKDRV